MTQNDWIWIILFSAVVVCIVQIFRQLKSIEDGLDVVIPYLLKDKEAKDEEK